MVTHSMDNILNMQYYPTNSHVDAAVHSPPMRKRRCLNKEVILSFLFGATGFSEKYVHRNSWNMLFRVIIEREIDFFLEPLDGRIIVRVLIRGSLSILNGRQFG